MQEAELSLLQVHRKKQTKQRRFYLRRNISLGMLEATRVLKDEIKKCKIQQQVENRIIFLTDMCDTSEDSDGPARLLEISEANSRIGIHASFIGVGVDFDTTVSVKFLLVL